MLRRSLQQYSTPFRGVARRAIVPSRSLRAPTLAVRFYSEQAKEAKDSESAESAGTEGDAEATPSSVEELQAALKELQTKFETKDKEAAALKERYTRTLMDFRNLQETTKRDVQNAKDFALQKFAKDLLESVDNFDRALSVVPEEKRADKGANPDLVSLYEGIRMTQDVFEKTLARHGLVKHHPLGEKFDPNVHEATFQVPDPSKEAGTVFHVQQSGFSLNDRVLRAAKVGIVKGSD